MIYLLSQKNSKNYRGFTLVEMLIVLGLFSFIMTLSTGVLYGTQAVNVKLQETQSILDNVNLSMDAMSREIRYGSDFHCGPTVPSALINQEASSTLRKNCSYYSGGGKFLIFKPVDAASSTDRVAYYASTTKNGDVILKDEYVGGATSTYQITANDVKVKSLMFYVVGANSTSDSVPPTSNVYGATDFVQPLITIDLSGETKPVMSDASSTKFIIQLSVSARSLDK